MTLSPFVVNILKVFRRGAIHQVQLQAHQRILVLARYHLGLQHRSQRSQLLIRMRTEIMDARGQYLLVPAKQLCKMI